MAPIFSSSASKDSRFSGPIQASNTGSPNSRRMRSRTAAHAARQSAHRLSCHLHHLIPIPCRHWPVSPIVVRLAPSAVFARLRRSTSSHMPLPLKFVARAGPPPSIHCGCRDGRSPSEIAFKAVRDIEGLANSPPASARWRRRASARPSGTATAPARPCRASALRSASATKAGIGAHRRESSAIRRNAPGGPRLERSGRPTKFHSAMVRTSTSWALGSRLEPLPRPRRR